MQNTTPPRLVGLDFAETEKSECLRTGRILRCTLEFGPACNLHCRYCYAAPSLPVPHPLTKDECCRVVGEAAAAGARTVVLVGGGEPLLYPFWRNIVSCIRSSGLTPVLFTNGLLLDEDAAAFLASARASVVLKTDTLDADIQDWLAGSPGAARTMRSAAATLIAGGFAATTDRRMAFHAVICAQNLHTLPDLWLSARRQNIIPLFQLVTARGRGAAPLLQVHPSDSLALFKNLLLIDQKEFGYSWPLQPPYVAGNCDKFLYNLYVNCSGQVSPCVGLDLPLGDIRAQSLPEILHSPAMSRVRNVMQNLHGPCSACVRAGKCYGCRGTAFAATGDPFASDPTCWRNAQQDV